MSLKQITKKTLLVILGSAEVESVFKNKYLSMATLKYLHFILMLTV